MSLLRFLATGDLQCHAWRQFSYTRKDGTNSRLYNCLRILDFMRHEAEKRGITKILLNGDIMEENAYVETEVYDAVFERVEKLHDAGLETVINLGNHDVLAKHGRRVIHTLRPFKRIAKVVEKPTLVWGHLQVVPWMASSEDIKRAISSLSPVHDMGLVLHCGIQGATTGPTSYLVRNPIKLRDVRPDDFAFVIASDYHTRQSLAKNVWYLGSPLQHSFGEIHRPCIWEIILDRGGSFTATKIYTSAPTFIRYRFKDLRDFKLKISVFTNNYVRIILPVSSTVDEGELEKLAHGKFQIQVERKSEQGSDEAYMNVHALAPEDAIFKYVAFHSSGGRLNRLNQMGNKIYRGEL
jgi:DNA repair exonuclease SbcCD nuclease subunit